MYLQGDLQSLFDALYHMGVIDPVLEADWSEAMNDWTQNYPEYKEIVKVANKNQGEVNILMKELEDFDQTTLGYLAMEVARELADYHSREHIH